MSSTRPTLVIAVTLVAAAVLAGPAVGAQDVPPGTGSDPVSATAPTTADDTVSGAGAPPVSDDGTASSVRINERPLAEAGLDRSVTQGAAVVLDGAGSRDPDGEIAAHRWTVEAPGGTLVTPDCPTCERAIFNATQVGEYAVTLTVEDDDGATDSDTLYVQVDPADPPDVSLSGPARVTVDDSPEYTVDITPGDLRVSYVRWTVDGRLAANRSPTAGDTLGVSFDTPGVHEVSVTAADVVGNTVSDSLTVRVVDASPAPPDDPGSASPTPPAARFTLDRTTVCVNDRVLADPGESADTDRLNGSSGGDAIDRTVWYVDGTRVTGNDGQPPQLLPMDTPGEVRARLVVHDDDGQRDSVTKTVEVLDEDEADCGDQRPPEAVIQYGGTGTVEAGTTLILDGSASYDQDNPDADGSEIASHEWTIDGERLTGERVEYTFDDPATVQLTVTDDDGAQSTTSVDISVQNRRGDGSSGGALIQGVEVETSSLVFDDEEGTNLDYGTISPNLCGTGLDGSEDIGQNGCVNLYYIAKNNDELSLTLRYERTDGNIVSASATTPEDITFRGIEQPGAHTRTVEVTVREVGDGYYSVQEGVITDTDTVTFCTTGIGFEPDGRTSNCNVDENKPLDESIDIRASTPSGPYGPSETVTSSATITNTGKFQLEEIAWEQAITTEVGGIGSGSGTRFSWSPTVIDYSATAIVKSTVTAEEPSNAPYDADIPEEWFTDSDTTGVTVCGTGDEIVDGECENDESDKDGSTGDGGSTGGDNDDGSEDDGCEVSGCGVIKPSPNNPSNGDSSPGGDDGDGGSGGDGCDPQEDWFC